MQWHAVSKPWYAVGTNEPGCVLMMAMYPVQGLPLLKSDKPLRLRLG